MAQSIAGATKNTPLARYTSIMRPEINPSNAHCLAVRDSRVRSQYHKNSATLNAERACDHDGSRYIPSGSELANQIATTAQNAHRSPTYFFASKNEKQSPMKP